jgi:hypothetical protein
MMAFWLVDVEGKCECVDCKLECAREELMMTAGKLENEETYGGFILS